VKRDGEKSFNDPVLRARGEGLSFSLPSLLAPSSPHEYRKVSSVIKPEEGNCKFFGETLNIMPAMFLKAEARN
jgi:hypothetical protein